MIIYFAQASDVTAALRAKGPLYPSLGQRPRYVCPLNPEG